MFSDEKQFENEVRRMARLLWPSAEHSGAVMEDGRERDGVFESEDFIHLIECTISRSKKKAENDLEKLQKLAMKYGRTHPDKFVKGWFITQDEPTADQRSVFQKIKGRIVATSFDQFRSKLVDSRSYLDLRKNYPFGSVLDPRSNSATSPLEYIPLDILDHSGSLHSIKDLCSLLLKGERFTLLGDYGAGKSATMREIFLRLASEFCRGNVLLFPLLLNLRDHHGQVEPAEALERHARNIGFGRPADLVRAWRAGLTVLLLDGFDEIATAGWAGRTKSLKDLRHNSMSLIRSFIRDAPYASGIMISGREHFFDSPNEMKKALDLGNRFRQLKLNEFNDQQIADYLKRMGWEQAVPEWIPSRPLLLGYLASRNLIQETLQVEAGSGPATGWNYLLERICVREAQIEAGIDPDTVRRLIEHIATLARSSIDGLGPISPDQILGAFTSVCGYPADDRGAVLLQRLPGL